MLPGGSVRGDSERLADALGQHAREGATGEKLEEMAAIGLHVQSVSHESISWNTEQDWRRCRRARTPLLFIPRATRL